MSVFGITEVTAANMRELRRLVRETCGFEVSENPFSRINFKLREMVRSPKKYDAQQTGEILVELAEKILLRNDVEAVIIWAGTHLMDPIIAKLQAAYNNLLDKAVDTDVLADRLFPAVDENARSLLRQPSSIQQALDQERIHAEVVAQAEKRLGRMVSQVRVFRPPNTSFINLPVNLIKPNWSIYQAGRDDPLIPGGLTQGKKILLTIGHGGNDGRTGFPPRGTLTQAMIARYLGVENAVDNRILYMPLQCFPQQAVQQWRNLNGVAQSMQQLNESNDVEMKAWITHDLAATVAAWADQYVVPGAAVNATTAIDRNPELDGDQDQSGDQENDL